MKFNKEQHKKFIEYALSKGWGKAPVDPKKETYRAQVLPEKPEPLDPVFKDLTMEDLELLLSRFRG